ncbi:Putative 5'(3')-deoxyribonucleotidase [Paraburkholderia nemoris]|uniref:5' nucleotidase, NT5C type n=1 Tax=Paraburkholderia nemoris TaxID=2793076 RepID=UPI000A7B2585|nr:hypothetical protein [Paraburkholderia nemoris]CAE6767770.1 Putative 5'(3')-deoxyribonucleotidase [Paraburkholderia nemoris]CAE6801433.1 Putative 5'(3')-deoxyribonucleotidase [Paraburkholderia nemoris]CAE6852548.1 Putative 5'(3')-deoxyribonucleotidase [Paraburkholderia nemoris]
MSNLLKPRLAIDMDEVLADAHRALVVFQRDTYGYELLDEELDGRKIQSLISAEHAKKMEELLHRGGVFRDFEVIAGSQAAVLRLMDRFDVFVTTAAMEYPASCAAKLAWLYQHFPFIPRLNIVLCGDKSILAADLLVDDNQHHFERFGGQGVLFSAPHNRRSTWPVRVEGWDDAVEYLEAWHAVWEKTQHGRIQS